MDVLHVGLIGCGTVGSGVARTLLDHGGRLAARVGSAVRLVRLCDRHRDTIKRLRIPRGLWTRDPRQIVRDPTIQVVIELIGGIQPAKALITEALRRRKHVVTANKALLAEHGQELFELAQRHGVELLFEAAVAGGIPIIKTLREGLVANNVDTILGIVNGTSNYILTQMAQRQLAFRPALAEAQQHGYAERDPSLDVNGYDAAHKLAILTLLAFGRSVQLTDIHIEGIQHVEPMDIQYAAAFGYVIKPLAIAKRTHRSLEVRVHPTLLSHEHLLANVQGVYNAIYVHGDLIGGQLFYGRGAGQRPTASAVVADVAELAQRQATGAMQKPPLWMLHRHELRLRPMAEIASRYYLRFSVIDRPGVLAQIAGILGRHHISISSVSQKERRQARTVPVVILTHEARERDVRRALTAIDRLPVIRRHTVALRTEAPAEDH